MQRQFGPVLFGAFLALCSLMNGTRALAATPAFTLSATNVTMPLNTQTTCSSSGCTTQYGYSTFTLTSVNGYTGGPQVTCAAVNPPSAAILPACYQHGLMPALPANGSVSGEILFIAPGQGIPPSPASLLERTGHIASGLVLSAVFLFGFARRRRAAHWFSLILLALATLGGTAAISACGGASNSMTPGTYSYSITATDSGTGDTSATTISVIIP